MRIITPRCTIQDDETAPIEMTAAASTPTAGTVTLTKKSKALAAADECRASLADVRADHEAAAAAAAEARCTAEAAKEDAAAAAERLHEVQGGIAGLEARRREAEDTYNDELAAFRRRGTLALEPTEKKAKKEAGSDNWPTVWLRAESGRLTIKLDGQPDSAQAGDGGGGGGGGAQAGGVGQKQVAAARKEGWVEQELDKKDKKWARRWWVLRGSRLLVFERQEAAAADVTPLHTIAVSNLGLADPKSKRKGRPGAARVDVADGAKIIVDLGAERSAWEAAVSAALAASGGGGGGGGGASERAIVGDLRGCQVGRPKSARKGYPHAFRLDLASPNSAGETKYILAAETALAADGWVATLENCSKYDSRSLLFSEQTCRNATDADYE